MAVFTFSINGAPRAIDLIGLSGDDTEAAIRRLRAVFGADFNPVGIRATGADAPNSLKIDSAGQFSDRFGNVISPQDFISGAIVRSGGTDPFATDDVTKGLPPDSLETQTPTGAFYRFLGETPRLGISSPASAARSFARSQYQPNLTAFLGSQLGGSLGSEVFDPADPNFENFAQRDRPEFGTEFSSFLRGGEGGFDPRQRLASAFRSVMPPAQPGGPQPGPSTYLGRALNPENVSEAAILGNLGRELQMSSVSPLLANYFRQPSNEDLFADFRGANPMGTGNFGNFIRSKFGLGQLGF